MAIQTYDPFTLMDQIQNDINGLFTRRGIDSGSREDSVTAADWVPAVDIHEEEDRFVIHADVPGVKPEEIEVTMDNGVLSIRGERNSTRETNEGGARRTERVQGTFLRRFTLPESADPEGIEASSAHGVLEVVIPKRSEVQPRKITVQA